MLDSFTFAGEQITLDDMDTVQAGFTLGLPRYWAQEYLTTEAGKPLDFSDRPALAAYYDDTYPRKAARKSTQGGLTTAELIEALHAVGVRGKTAIYTLPTDGLVGKFVKGRLNRIIAGSPELQRLVARQPGEPRVADSMFLKRIGNAMLYLGGTQSPTNAVSVSADKITHDELDASNPEVVDLYYHRLDAVDPPELKELTYISTPTVPRYGISVVYEDSDQREWHIACTHCTWRGPAEYWSMTDGERSHLHCPRCDGILDPRIGRWVALVPGRDIHGYQFSALLDALPHRPDRLLHIHTRRRKALYQYIWTNSYLGLPDSTGTYSLPKSLLLGKCFLDDYPPEPTARLDAVRYFAGLDQGDTLTLVIGRNDPYLDGNKMRVVWVERLRDESRGMDAWRQVEERLRAFNVEMTVVDGMPGGAPAHELAKHLRGRVLCCYYKDNLPALIQESADVRRQIEHPDAEPLRVQERVDITVDRTATLDILAASLTSSAVLLPGPPTHPEIDLVLDHIEANVRKPELDRNKNTVYRWVKMGANDYFHALNYLLIAATEAGSIAERAPDLSAPLLISGVTPLL